MFVKLIIFTCVNLQDKIKIIHRNENLGNNLFFCVPKMTYMDVLHANANKKVDIIKWCPIVLEIPIFKSSGM